MSSTLLSDSSWSYCTLKKLTYCYRKLSLDDRNHEISIKITGVRTNGGIWPGLSAIQLVFGDEISSPIIDSGHTFVGGRVGVSEELQTYSINLL